MLTEKEESVALIFLDACTTLVSWMLAYHLRFSTFIPGAQVGLEGYFFLLSLPLILITVFIFYRNDLYVVSPRPFHTFIKSFTQLIQCNTKAFFSFVILLYFLWPERISRITLVNYLVISTFLFLVIRSGLQERFIQVFHPHKKKKIVLIGDGQQLQIFNQQINKLYPDDFEVVGKINSLEELEAKFDSLRPDQLVIGHSLKNQHQLEKDLQQLHHQLLPINILLPSSFGPLGHRIEMFGDVPLLSINRAKIGNWEYLVKRSFDFFVTLIGLILISPLLLTIMVLVKLTSKGPIFYGQERMGLDGKNFLMWKFRSMRVDAENETGAVWCKEDDPRRTRFGSFLRKSSLDELPQLWNVLRGEMSLVGPRPERPVFVHKFKTEIPHYMLRHKMKAGITGWAQVNGLRGNTSLEDRILYDLYYIKNWSLPLDIKILFLTLWKGLFHQNAY